MNRIAAIPLVLVLALAGCAYSRTQPTEREKAMQIVDYGLSRPQGRSNYDKAWERIKFRENAKFLNPRAAGIDYCFDCDMRKRGVSDETLRQWHEVITDQLRERLRTGDMYDVECRRCGSEMGWNTDDCNLSCVEHQPFVTRHFSELAGGGGAPTWTRFRERVMAALTSREDFRRYFPARGDSLPELSSYPDLWPSEIGEHAPNQIGETEAIDMGLINVLIHARRCLSGYDGCP